MDFHEDLKCVDAPSPKPHAKLDWSWIEAGLEQHNIEPGEVLTRVVPSYRLGGSTSYT